MSSVAENGLTACGDCGENIPKKAKYCPKCGKPVVKFPWKLIF